MLANCLIVDGFAFVNVNGFSSMTSTNVVVCGGGGGGGGGIDVVIDKLFINSSKLCKSAPTPLLLLLLIN